MIQPQVKMIEPRRLIGMQREMTFADDHTGPLFAAFMPNKKIITGTLDNDVYCVKIFACDPYTVMTKNLTYTKWAAQRVEENTIAPPAMASLDIPAGLYAVFKYQGLPSGFGEVAQFFYQQWLPASGYCLDARPHFDLLPPGYSANDPNAQEWIHIPVKKIDGDCNFSN